MKIILCSDRPDMEVTIDLEEKTHRVLNGKKVLGVTKKKFFTDQLESIRT